MPMKKRSKFTIGIIIYIAVFLLAMLIVDDMLWTRLEQYEVVEEKKAEEQRLKFALAAERAAFTPTPTPSPTPTPAPIVLEQIKLVKPKDAVLYISGEPYVPEDTEWQPDTDATTFRELLSITGKYAEYKGLIEPLLPEVESIVLTLEKGTTVSFMDADGTMVTPVSSTTKLDVDGEQRTIRLLTCPYYIDYSVYDEAIQMGFDFMIKYSLFCSNDKPASEMKTYFPERSEYYKEIASLDNSWFNQHSKLPEYTEQTVLDYCCYGDLLYMKLKMHQSFVSSYNGTKFDDDIIHPLWFVKMDGQWKVAAIVHDSGTD